MAVAADGRTTPTEPGAPGEDTTVPVGSGRGATPGYPRLFTWEAVNRVHIPRPVADYALITNKDSSLVHP
ncbi:hypothetical protein J6590_021477 [Homalodisca vitripennis]|nr:hypothetical protein J6590_021477 [Homalodisca vitripennis]